MEILSQTNQQHQKYIWWLNFEFFHEIIEKKYNRNLFFLALSCIKLFTCEIYLCQISLLYFYQTRKLLILKHGALLIDHPVKGSFSPKNLFKRHVVKIKRHSHWMHFHSRTGSQGNYFSSEPTRHKSTKLWLSLSIIIIFINLLY